MTHRWNLDYASSQVQCICIMVFNLSPIPSFFLREGVRGWKQNRISINILEALPKILCSKFTTKIIITPKDLTKPPLPSLSMATSLPPLLTTSTLNRLDHYECCGRTCFHQRCIGTHMKDPLVSRNFFLHVQNLEVPLLLIVWLIIIYS